MDRAKRGVLRKLGLSFSELEADHISQMEGLLVQVAAGSDAARAAGTSPGRA